MATNTTATSQTHNGDGSTATFAISFSFLENTEVDVTVGGVLKTLGTHYNISGSSVTFTSGNIPPSGTANIKFTRDTNISTKKVDFADGSVLTETDLDNNSDQILFAQQEITDKLGGIEEGATGDQTAAEIRTLVESATDSNVFTDADHTKLNGIETAATADQTASEIRTLVESASDSNVFTDADHTKLNGIEASATADQTAAEIRTLVESASDSNVFTDADHSKLNAIEAGATADQTVSEIKSLIAGSPLDASHLAANSVGTSEIADAELTTLAGMQSGTASKLADSTALTADLADLNQLDGMAKQTTITDDDTKFPTSGAIVDYVAAQLAPIGGLEVIATDAAFPNTQPAAGVVISIADAGGLVVNSSGTSTTARTVGGATVTINNFASNFNSSTVDAGVAIMVSSTGTGNVYNYHKATLKEADLLSLSNDINDFAARYRVTAGEPTSNNDEGDLIYDKNADKMKVFDSSTNAFKEVTSVGDFKFLFLCPTGGSGSPTFNGSIATYDLRETSNSGSAASVTSAAQLLVSVNGVVQKPNTGTSAPSEGFAMVDSNTIIFGTNLPTGAEVFVIQIGSAISLQVPADNTVSTAKIQNQGVTTAKIADDAVTTAKLAKPIDLADNEKIRLGNSQDLEIFHDGSQSIIKDNGTGQLRISGENTVAITNAAATENYAKFIKDGAVELFHNNVKRCETSADGFNVIGKFSCTGNIDLPDDVDILLGDNDEFRIFHDESNGLNYIQAHNNGPLILRSSSATLAQFNPSQGVKLNYNGSLRLETTDEGATVHDSSFATLEIRANTNDAVLKLTSHNDDTTDWTIHNDYSESNDFDVRFNNTRKMNLDISGNLSIKGGLKLNGDTAAANELDDYEEGTFTPEFNAGSAATACFASGVSYSAQVGVYRKIGKMVYFIIKIQASSATAKSGQLQINNLPFASGDFSSNATAGGAYITLTNAFTNSTHMPTAFISGSGTNIKFFQTNSNAWAGTDLDTPTGFIHLAGAYPTSS